MIKYKHKETGLFLTKKKYGYSKVYTLTKRGTNWSKDCFSTLSRTKNPSEYGVEQYWRREEFELVKYNLDEEETQEPKGLKKQLEEIRREVIHVDKNLDLTLDKFKEYLLELYLDRKGLPDDFGKVKIDIIETDDTFSAKVQSGGIEYVTGLGGFLMYKDKQDFIEVTYNGNLLNKENLSALFNTLKQ